MALLAIPFDVASPFFEERHISTRTAAELALYFAKGKADSVAGLNAEAIVIGSDTLIELDGEVLGKPADLLEARAMLGRMAGREHLVHTAVALSCLNRSIESTNLSTAHVWMRPFNETALDEYLETGDSLGKAGAYSIQGPGGALIERIDGDFTAVVGLPLQLTASMLEQVGVQIPVDLSSLYAAKPYGNWARFIA
ncbi:MAG TPA: Maf family protein [Nitrospira sp.]